MLGRELVGWCARGWVWGRRTKIICCDYDAVFELEADDGCSCDNGLLRVLCRAAAGEVTCVICPIDIISGLEEVSKVVLRL